MSWTPLVELTALPQTSCLDFGREGTEREGRRKEGEDRGREKGKGLEREYDGDRKGDREGKGKGEGAHTSTSFVHFDGHLLKQRH